ncbi:hypothetical protein EGT07_22690 [Herbaspirillum sp. HC18]|nr:hypothetical protein EGT07_22690 [Herbaspirillum sp. HC18]
MGETVERILKLHPRLRLANRYQSRLTPALAVALKYVEDLVASVPQPRDATAAAWAHDPYIHAFFIAPDDIARVISRSPDLRAYFECNPDVQEVCAVLGMAMTERRTLGVALEAGNLRRDVVQTTVNFSDHQVRMCGRSEEDLRHAIVRRLVDQLALDGLARIAEDRSRRDLLEQERALLQTRLQLLERQGEGMRAMLGGGTEAVSEDLARLQEQMEENERNMDSLGVKTDALDIELDRMCEIFSDPQEHLYLNSKRLRLDRMNIIQERIDQQDVEEIDFQTARIPTNPPQTRAFSLIRFARADLLPVANLLDTAERLL